MKISLRRKNSRRSNTKRSNTKRSNTKRGNTKRSKSRKQTKVKIGGRRTKSKTMRLRKSRRHRGGFVRAGSYVKLA